jgi:hypothetical protein
MSYLYFDESIRDNGDFIVGALVLSDFDLSKGVADLWIAMGLDPVSAEFKSSGPKFGDPVGRHQRTAIRGLFQSLQLASVLCPRSDRRRLGTHLTSLVHQLLDTGLLMVGQHDLYVDQNIAVSPNARAGLAARGVVAHVGQDSRIVAGIQVADCAAHSLGGMLLEQMGILAKKVLVDEGGDPGSTPEVELGFELWACLRYAILGKNEDVPGHSSPGDPANPYFKVDGYGLYIAPSCSDSLSSAARSRFGVNYLGCIH